MHLSRHNGGAPARDSGATPASDVPGRANVRLRRGRPSSRQPAVLRVMAKAGLSFLETFAGSADDWLAIVTPAYATTYRGLLARPEGVRPRAAWHAQHERDTCEICMRMAIVHGLLQSLPETSDGGAPPAVRLRPPLWPTGTDSSVRSSRSCQRYAAKDHAHVRIRGPRLSITEIWFAVVVMLSVGLVACDGHGAGTRIGVPADERCEFDDTMGGQVEPGAKEPVPRPKKKAWEARSAARSPRDHTSPRASPAGRAASRARSSGQRDREFLHGSPATRGAASRLSDREHACRSTTCGLTQTGPASATTRTSRPSASTSPRSPRPTRSASSPGRGAGGAARALHHARSPRDVRRLLLQLLRHDDARAHEPLRLVRRLGMADGRPDGGPRRRSPSWRARERLIDAQTIASSTTRRRAHAHGYWTSPRTLAVPLRRPLRRVASREPGRDRQGRRAGAALVPHGADVPRRVPVAGADPQRRAKDVRGHAVFGGWYEWRDVRYVPSWGGSLFEALMPTLVLDEPRFAPASLGANDLAHATVQRRYAVETLGYPVWGLSSSATPAGPLRRARRARPRHDRLSARRRHTARVRARARRHPRGGDREPAPLAARYPIYGDFGFYDAVDPDAAPSPALT